MANLVPVLNRYLAGSPLAGQGANFVRIGAKYGIDPRVFAVIATKETSLARAGAGVSNPYGLGVHLGWKFPNAAAATDKLAQTLTGKLYKGAGKNTLAQIIPTYAPKSENNTALYVNQVRQWGRGLGLDPNASVFTSPGAPVSAPVTPVRAGVPAPAPAPTGAQPLVTVQPQIDLRRALALLGANRRDVLAGRMPAPARYAALRGLVQQARMGATQAAVMSLPPGAATPGNTRRTGPAFGGPIGGAVYGGVLGTKGPLIGTPYAGTHTLGNWESDDAVDIRVPVGTPVYAPRAGVIGPQFGSLGSSGRFQGIRVHLQIPGNELFYAHLSRTAPGVKPGVRVKAGQLLGYSGEANGIPHLHLGIRHGDPRKVLGL